MTTTRMDTLKAEITQAYATKFQEAAALGAKDPAAMSKAIMEIQAEIDTQANARIATEKTAAVALAESESKGKKALETNVQDLFGTTAKAVQSVFESLQTVGQVVCRLDKDKDNKMTVSVVVGNLTKVGGSTGGTRNHKLTVNGTQYDTVEQAWKGVMGDTPQPTKEVIDKNAKDGTGKRQSKTKDVAVKGMTDAGHTVS